MKTSNDLDKIAPALVAALADMTGAVKDSKNPHFKNSYASLESVIDTARPLLKAHGLAFMQGLGEYVNGAMTVSTRIIHESGQWVESDFQMPVGKPDPQGTASASTYARRYALMSILGLPSVDDDGEAAMPRNQPQAAPAPAKRDTGPGEVDGVDWWGAEGPGVSAHQAKKDGWDDIHEQLRSQIDKIHTAADWKDFCATNSADIKKMPKAWRMILRGEAEERGKFLGAIQ
jgi:hypothetical protein